LRSPDPDPICSNCAVGGALNVGITCATLGGSRQAAPHGDPSSALLQRGKVYAVTLITGDRVLYTVTADGAQSATVEAGAARGRKACRVA